MSQPLLEQDGLTLRQAPRQYWREQNGFLTYLAALERRLNATPTYRHSSLPQLVKVLREAASRGVLRPLDCRALLKANIQFLRMFSEMFPDVMTAPLKDRTFPRNKPQPNRPSYVLLSQVLDFFLFCVESRHPCLNFLTVNRLPYEMLPLIDDNLTDLRSLPYQRASLMRWRRHLRDDKAFQLYEKDFARDYDSLGHWVFLAPIEGLPQGALFVSPSGTIADLRLEPESGRYDVLGDVCRKFRIEMISSYESEYWRGRALNVLPNRIHLDCRNHRVTVSIPDFYSHDIFRSDAGEDLALVSSVLKRGDKSPPTSVFVEREVARPVGVKLRHALRQAHGRDMANKAILVIWKALSYPPERVLTSGWRERITGPLPSVSEAVEAVRASQEFVPLSRKHSRIWCDMLFALTALGVWEPPILDQH